MTYDYLINGEEEYNKAIHDNTILDDKEADFYGDLLDLLSFSITDYEDIDNTRDYINNNLYPLKPYNEIEKAIETLDSIAYDYQPPVDKIDQVDMQHDFKKEKSIIRYYAHSYKKSNYAIGSLLELDI